MYDVGGELVIERNWKLCNTAFESGVALEDWRYVVILLAYKSKEGGGERKN